MSISRNVLVGNDFIDVGVVGFMMAGGDAFASNGLTVVGNDSVKNTNRFLSVMALSEEMLVNDNSST